MHLTIVYPFFVWDLLLQEC